MSGVDSKDAKAFLLDDAAPSNATQMALVEASALSGSLSSSRPAASPEPFTSARAGASAGDRVVAGEGFGRTPSFEGRFAERTPSDWDRVFKTETDVQGVYRTRGDPRDLKNSQKTIQSHHQPLSPPPHAPIPHTHTQNTDLLNRNTSTQFIQQSQLRGKGQKTYFRAIC